MSKNEKKLFDLLTSGLVGLMRQSLEEDLAPEEVRKQINNLSDKAAAWVPNDDTRIRVLEMLTDCFELSEATPETIMAMSRTIVLLMNGFEYGLLNMKERLISAGLSEVIAHQQIILFRSEVFLSLSGDLLYLADAVARRWRELDG